MNKHSCIKYAWTKKSDIKWMQCVECKLFYLIEDWFIYDTYRKEMFGIGDKKNNDDINESDNWCI